MKIYDGTNWQESKAVKIHTGSGWASAIKGWVYNSGWQLGYPNYPLLVSGPTFTYSGTTYPTPGSIWQANTVWNSDPAYLPSSYTFKWYRDGIEIPGATSVSYTATTSDIDKQLSVMVTATNARGSTSASGGIGTIILPGISSLTAFDSTVTPSASISLTSINNLNYSGSYSSSSATSVSVTTTNGSVSQTGTTSGSFSGTGSSSGSVTVYASPVNTNKQVSLLWPAAPGAVSYDVYKYGNNVQTVINVGNTTSYTWAVADGNESNYFSVYPRSAGGYQGYGIQQIVSTSNKFGAAASASGNLVQTPPPSGGSTSLTPSGTVQARTTITATTSFSTGSPTAYEIQIRKATGVSPADENSGNPTTNGIVSGSSTTHVISDSEASGTPDQFAAFGRAYNAAGGWSAWVKSNTVTSTPYVAPVVSYTVTYNANGGSGGGQVSFNEGSSTVALGAPSRSGYTFNGWYDTQTLDWSYFASANGTWTPPSRNITMYARWTAVATGSAPSITVSNTYDGFIGGAYQWTLTINNTSSTAATGYSWGVQFSSTSGGAVGASAVGSGGSIPANGSVTVTRNNSTYTWARWVNVVASNGYGSSTTETTGWA